MSDVVQETEVKEEEYLVFRGKFTGFRIVKDEKTIQNYLTFMQNTNLKLKSDMSNFAQHLSEDDSKTIAILNEYANENTELEVWLYSCSRNLDKAKDFVMPNVVITEPEEETVEECVPSDESDTCCAD